MSFDFSLLAVLSGKASLGGLTGDPARALRASALMRPRGNFPRQNRDKS